MDNDSLESKNNPEFEGLYAANIIEFIAVANDFCHLTEKCSKLSKKEFVSKSLKLLPLLYLKAEMLPGFELMHEGVTEKFVQEIDWQMVINKTAQRLGTHDEYVEIYEPVRQESGDVNSLTMSECFADMYQDLKNCVMLYNIGNEEAMNTALYECKENYKQYWGQRLLALLPALHNLQYGEENLDEE